MTRPKGSGQSIGNSRAAAPARERLLLRLVHLADELDRPAVDVGLKLLLEVGCLAARNLSGDAQVYSGGARDADGVLGALFRGEATEERQIGSSIERRAKVVRWQSVRDRGCPIRLRQWHALMVRYRYEAGVGKLPQHIGKTR